MCCPIEYVADKVSMRIQQLEIKCETKTLDNVFVNGMFRTGGRHDMLLADGDFRELICCWL